jgi:hypothetical protein
VTTAFERRGDGPADRARSARDHCNPFVHTRNPTR